MFKSTTGGGLCIRQHFVIQHRLNHYLDCPYLIFHCIFCFAADRVVLAGAVLWNSDFSDSLAVFELLSHWNQSLATFWSYLFFWKKKRLRAKLWNMSVWLHWLFFLRCAIEFHESILGDSQYFEVPISVLVANLRSVSRVPSFRFIMATIALALSKGSILLFSTFLSIFSRKQQL